MPMFDTERHRFTRRNPMQRTQTRKNIWPGVLAGIFVVLPFCSSAMATPQLLIDGTAAYTGNTGSGGAGFLTADDDQILWQFQLLGQGVFTAYTTSFATGGFAPNLTLFYDDGQPGDPTGLFIAQGAEGTNLTVDPNGCPIQQVDQTTQSGNCLDTFLQTTLDPGNYLLVLTEDPNVSFGDGIAYNSGNAFIYPPGSGNFTYSFAPENSEQQNFWLFDNTPRTGAFNVTSDFEPTVPEPGTLGLLFTGAAALAFFVKRKTAANQA
jgi:hypothetical protein